MGRKGGGGLYTTLDERMGIQKSWENTCISLYLGKQICDSENKNGHAWLSATRLEGICMQLVGWGGRGCLRLAWYAALKKLEGGSKTALGEWLGELLYACSEWDWLLNVTCNDISVMYVTVHRCAGGLKKKLDLRSGFQRFRHFVGFFNVPVQAPARGQPFYGYSEKPPPF